MPVGANQADAEREALQSKLAEAEARASEYKDGWARKTDLLALSFQLILQRKICLKREKTELTPGNQ